MSFPKYPEYKDSGVEWLGKVPVHWRVMPFKWVIESNDGGAWGDDPVGEGDTLVLRSTDQTVDGNWRIRDPAERHLSASEKRSTLLAEGDLLVTKSSGSSLHIGKTTLVTPKVSGMNCCFGNFMQRIRTKETLKPKIAWYIMNNAIAREQLDTLSSSTTGLANLNGTLIGEILLSIPPEDEQLNIAAFLDHETARIDALIDEQKRLIKLLKEKRQAVISHAVTKGLDPNVPMKDSGVEWLGEVPAHWEVNSFKRLLLKPLDYGANEAANESNSGDPRFVRITDVRDDGSLRDETFRSLPPSVAEPYLLQEGDILLARTGGTVGKSFIYDKSWGVCCFAGYLVRARLNTKVADASYIYNCLQSDFYWEYIEREQIQSTIQNVSAERYSRLVLPVPPKYEQKIINDYISEKTAGMDDLIQKACDSVDLLEERRSSLISASVTGKIDVRNWQPPTANFHSVESADEGTTA